MSNRMSALHVAKERDISLCQVHGNPRHLLDAVGAVSRTGFGCMRNNSAYPFNSVSRACAFRLFQCVYYKGGKLFSDEPSRLLRQVPKSIFHVPEFVHKNVSEHLLARFSFSVDKKKDGIFEPGSNQIVRQESRWKDFESSHEVSMNG
jgi:hypothetical protein